MSPDVYVFCLALISSFIRGVIQGLSEGCRIRTLRLVMHQAYAR